MQLEKIAHMGSVVVLVMAMLNDILHRALSEAIVASRLEPMATGLDLDRADGKHPDGITMVPWSNGRLLVWDATCLETFAPSIYPWPAAQKYNNLISHAFETTEVCVLHSMSLLSDLCSQTPLVKALWHTYCKRFLLPFRGGMLHLFWELCL